MTALNTMQFAGFTLRPAGQDDRALAEQWTAWDRDHAGKVDPGFWLEQRVGMDSFLLNDGDGPVFFFKTRLAIEEEYTPTGETSIFTGIPILSKRRTVRAELHIQFMPCATEEDHERTRRALLRGLEWLEPVLGHGGAEEIYFDSRDLKLITFAQKKLGFYLDPGGQDRLLAMHCAGSEEDVRLRKRLGVRGQGSGVRNAE
jgi:hypothetical protein